MKFLDYLNFRNSGYGVFLIPILSVLLLSSCKDDPDEDWAPTFAGPLVNSTLNVDDILEEFSADTIFDIDESGLISFIKEEPLFEYNPLEVVEFTSLPSFSGEFNEVETGGILTALDLNGQFNLATSQDLVFQAENPTGNEVEIDSLIAFEGYLYLNFSTELGHEGSITITIPEAVKDGLPFQAVLDWESSTTQIVVSDSFSLSGYYLDLTQSTQGYSEIAADFELEFIKSGDFGEPDDQTSWEVKIEAFQIDEVYGNFGTSLVEVGKDTFNIDVFGSDFDADLFLSDPKIILDIQNETGISMNAYIPVFQYVEGDYEQVVDIFNDPNGFNEIEIDAAMAVGDTSFTQVIFDNSVGDISGIVRPEVTALIYEVTGVTSPTGIGFQKNFLTRSDKISADITFELPLAGSLTGLSMEDTLEFSFDQDFADLDELLIKTNIDSYFPANATFQAYFTDANYVVTDSLFNAGETALILSPEIGTDGRPIGTEPFLTSLEIPVDSASIMNVTQASNIILQYTIDTGGDSTNSNVSLYDDYYIDVKVGFQATGRIKL